MKDPIVTALTCMIDGYLAARQRVRRVGCALGWHAPWAKGQSHRLTRMCPVCGRVEIGIPIVGTAEVVWVRA